MRRSIPIVVAGLLLCGSAFADEQSNEDRLRDALRQAVTQMRAAQDQAAQAQAAAQQAQAEKQKLQTDLDALKARAVPAKPAAPAVDVAAMHDALAQAQAQVASLQQGLAKWQAAYNNAADVARSKDAEAQQSAGGLKSQTRALDICKAENTKLIGVGEEILHLYETQSFRSILLRSYEPVIGTAKVKLENMVQDYDDKLHDQEYIAPPAPPAR